MIDAKDGPAGAAWLSEAAVREVQTVSRQCGSGGVARGRRPHERGNPARRTNGSTARRFSLTARTPGARRIHSRSGCRTPARRQRAPSYYAPCPITPPDHETTWGVGLGSRIRRDKLFWFAAIDSYRRNDPGLATVKNPARVLHHLRAHQPGDCATERAIWARAPTGNNDTRRSGPSL